MTIETLATAPVETPEHTASASFMIDRPHNVSLTLRDSVDQALSNYFSQLEDLDVRDVYAMVLSEVEAPLLEQTLEHCNHNQTRAARILGLNRGTLRKKLKRFDLLTRKAISD